MDTVSDDQKKLYEARAHNLAQILKRDFGDDLDALLQEIGLKKDTFTKYLNPSSDRPCTDRTARKIESALGKPLHSLDFLFEEHKEIYYVGIGTNALYTYEVVKALQSEEAVQECSVVLGDIDILIKVEVESFRFLDILLAKIVRMPGVKRSKTYVSAKNLHWQRAQKEKLYLPEKDEKLYFSKGIEEFIHRKMMHHFNEIRELERGEISIKDEENLSLEHHQIITGTQKTLMATRNPRETVPNFEKYIQKEAELIQQGVHSQRIIFLTKNFRDEWDDIVEKYNQYINIGCEIRFIFRENWLPSPLSMFWEIFIVVDNDFVCVRRDDQGRVLIKRTREIIDEYINTFTSNWNNSLVFNDIVKFLSDAELKKEK